MNKADIDGKFYEYFTEEELEKVLRMASVWGHSCIVISTEKYFFELSADLGEGIEIYYDEQGNEERNHGIIDKVTFFNLLEASSKVLMPCIVIYDKIENL